MEGGAKGGGEKKMKRKKRRRITRNRIGRISPIQKLHSKRKPNKKEKIIETHKIRKQSKTKIGKKKPRLVEGNLSRLLSSAPVKKLKMEKIDKQLMSRIPKPRNSTMDVYLKNYYKNDLIFRLLFDTRQIMFIADNAIRGIQIHDNILNERTNRFQYELFQKMENIIKETIKLPDPKPGDSNVPVIFKAMITKDNVDDISRSLNDSLKNSPNIYCFRYLFFNLIHACDNLKEIIKPYILNSTKFNTLIYLLDNMFLGKNTIGVQGQIHNENKFNKIFDLVRNLAWMYMMNFGYLRTESGSTYVQPTFPIK